MSIAFVKRQQNEVVWTSYGNEILSTINKSIPPKNTWMKFQVLAKVTVIVNDSGLICHRAVIFTDTQAVLQAHKSGKFSYLKTALRKMIVARKRVILQRVPSLRRNKVNKSIRGAQN